MNTLKTGAQVVDELLARYGPARLGQVEQTSERCFQAHLSGGDIAVAVIGPDGGIMIQEAEPCAGV